ncbi:MAG: hypothetical protein WCS89_02185 [Candidatus Paceibacterota bacterium]|jgi:hypothetical protein
MPLLPYIGITDFTNFEQVQRMLGIMHKQKPKDSRRQLHVGVMMSRKTLNNIETEWSKVFPPKEVIASIFGSGETYNCLHYADYKNKVWFSGDLSRAIGYGGIGINAVQLDMTWPDPGQIADAIHTSRKQIEVILQIGRGAIEGANNNPAEIIQRLKDYEGVIHRVLLDKSMGRGICIDATGLIPFISAIKRQFPDLGITVAGGLNHETLFMIEPLIKMFPDLSIDAQGRLRPSGNPLDPIDWDIAEKYLSRALRLLK